MYNMLITKKWSYTMVKGVLELANEFMAKSDHVTINEACINGYCNIIREDINKEPYFMGEPKISLIEDRDIDRISQIVLYELMAGAVNYKYWYGRYDVRPNEACANKMYSTLDKTFGQIIKPQTVSSSYCSALVDTFSINLCSERFPMLKERSLHLAELKENLVGRGDPNNPPNASFFVHQLALDISDGTEDAEVWLKILVQSFPGFAQDMFLKRASLFFMMLYRRMGWFKDSIHKLPIPADYQIPKILEAEGCLKYSHQLKNDIIEGKLIPKGSLMECEIRAAAIVACQKIAKECGVTMCKVDDYMWLKRKEYDMPFHLTMTTDY